MNVNMNYINQNGVKYEGVMEKAFKKDELSSIGKLVHQTERDEAIFGKENGVYIYQDRDNENLGYRIYDEFADYGFNGYNDEKLIYELNKRKNNVKLTDFPKGVVTRDGSIVGQIITYYPNSETIFNYATRTKNVDIIKYYKIIINIVKELYKNGIIYCDAHAKNFLIVNNNIKLIDFEHSSMNFENSKCCYESMVYNLISTIDRLNSIVGITHNIDVRVNSIEDLEESVNKMEKKLVK